jgi:hypothetical protein
MYSFLTDPDNLLFSGALLLLLVIAAIEMVSLLTGAGLFDFLDDLLPGFADSSVDAEGSVPIADALLGWLNLKKVPFIIGLLGFLFLFGAIGLKLQLLWASIFGGGAPYWISIPLILALVLIPLRLLNRVLSCLIPKDESMAVSPDRFVGRVAVITIGEACLGKPAEAKLVGPLGRTHYVMVEPDESGVSFPQGSQVLIVGRKGSHFSVISITNPNLKP